MAEKELDVILQAIARNTDAIAQTQQRIQGLDGAAKSVSSSTKIADEALGNLTVTTTKHGDALNTTITRTQAVGAAERDLSRDGQAAARAMGEMGAKGAELTDRLGVLGGVMGSGGAMGVGIGAALVGLGALAEGVKKVDETYQEQQHAEESLKQAMDATAPVYTDKAARLDDLNKRFDDFANTNARFIDNENTAKDVLAAFVRAGFDTDTAMQALQVSLNLAAIKQEDLGQAGNQVLLMMEGQGRVARQLGIDIKALSADDVSATQAHKDFEVATKAVAAAQTQLEAAQLRARDAGEQLKKTQDGLAGTHKTTAAQADTLHMAEQRVADTTVQVKDASDKLTTAQGQLKDAQDKVNDSVGLGTQVLGDLKTKTDNGTASISQQQQATNELNHQWDIFAKDTGPAVEYAWEVILGTVEGLLELLNDIPGAVSAAGSALASLGGSSNNIPAGVSHRQHGGYIGPGETATVGEAGMEVATGLPGGGAWITPNAGRGGGGGVVINQYIYGSGDAEAAADAAARRLAQLFA